MRVLWRKSCFVVIIITAKVVGFFVLFLFFIVDFSLVCRGMNCLVYRKSYNLNLYSVHGYIHSSYSKI